MKKLLDLARLAREKAYVPYSGFKVGAAVLAASGRIYTGCNIENASYGLTNCAERTAIFKAISEGDEKLTAIAVVGDTPAPIAPCGACRQVMAEFGIETVIMANLQGKQLTLNLADLLPNSFAKSDLSGGVTVEETGRI